MADSNNRGETLFKVDLIDGEGREVNLFLVAHIEDIDTLVDLYKKMYGMEDSASIIVHEDYNEHVVEHLEGNFGRR